MLFLGRTTSSALVLSASVAAVLLSGCLRETAELPVDDSDAQRILSIVPAAERENTWSGWRGGIVHGVSSDRTFPRHWNSSDGVVWRTPLGGPANSSPIVWEDRVFCVAHALDGKQAELCCLERSTGQVAWRQSLGRDEFDRQRKNGHAAPTPCTDGERVYVGTPSGLWCFTVNGERRWHVGLDVPAHRWGHSASPVLCGDLVIQLADGESGSFLAAFDRQTGREIWRVARASTGSWTTPAVAPVVRDGQPAAEIIVNGSGTSDGSEGFVTSYDAASGETLWQVGGTTDIPCPTAIVGGGYIVSTSGSNGPILALRASGAQANTDRVAWRLPTGGPYAPTGLVLNGALYVLDDRGRLVCRDLRSGSTLWTARLRGSFSASLVAGDGVIYATSEQGETTVLAASPVEFRPLAVNRLNEGCLATPALAGGELFVRTEAALYCIDGMPQASTSASITSALDAATGAASELPSTPTELHYKPPVAAPVEEGSSPSDLLPLPRFQQ